MKNFWLKKEEAITMIQKALVDLREGKPYFDIRLISCYNITIFMII